MVVCLASRPAEAQEARRRWEMQRQIRLDKFEQVLPLAMKNAGIDMWIVAVKENHIRPAVGRPGPRLRHRHRLLHVLPARRSRGAAGARAERLSASNESGAYDGMTAGRDAAGVRAPARPEAHRRQHVGGDRPGRRPVGHDARAPREDARRAVRVASRERREAGVGVPLAPRRLRDRRLRRSRRHRHPAGRAGALERSDHARQDHPRRRGVVAAGPAARARRSARSSTCRRST